MTLPAYAADRRRACSTAPAVRPQLSIDISSPQEAQQQTRRPLLLLSINGTDRWTDRLTDAHRYIDPAPRAVRAASIRDCCRWKNKLKRGKTKRKTNSLMKVSGDGRLTKSSRAFKQSYYTVFLLVIYLPVRLSIVITWFMIINLF